MRLFLTTTLLATLATAQGPTLIGLTAQIPALLQRDQTACVDTLCTPAFPQTVGLPYLGGTGWDPIRSGAWISNGPSIGFVTPGCVTQCAPAPTPTPGLITGLDVVESLNEIWATDSLSNICRLTRTCPPTLINVCNTGIVPTATRGLSGLAVDEGRQLVFYCGADWATGTSQLRVANMATPCAPFHQQPVVSFCSPLVLRPLTGLAVDWGNRVLYFTDGIQTVGWSYVYNPAGPSIAFTPLNCCLQFPGDTLVGLAVRTNPPVPAGPPCANGTCPSCPMVHTASGDPNLGNAFFSLDLNGAPAGSVAICALSLGSCMVPGFPIPGLCGPLWLPLPLWGTSPAMLPAGGGCSASASFALPLPANPAFAGLPIASQWLAFCGGGGTTMSNCLSFVLQGN